MVSTMTDRDYDDDYDERDDTPGGESNPFKELRGKVKEKDKTIKDLNKELEELRSFRAEYETNQRVSTASQIFEKLELPAAQAKLFAKLNPDVEVTEDAVRSFATEYGLAVPDEAPEEESTSFKPVSVAGASQARGRISYEEYQTLLAENPTAAFQAVADDRVDGMMRTPRDKG